MAFMRRSKYKHVFGKANKRDECFDSIRITKSSWDSTFCSVNVKYVAIITECAGGGAFIVIPHEKVGRVDTNHPSVAGHKAAVLDIQWNPFSDDLIASASEDCTVKVWEIPEDLTTVTEPVADLVAHQRRVGLVKWHPTASNILLSAGADNMVFIWNVETEEPVFELNFPDMVLSACFNFDGSRFAATCKDKITRICDPRKSEDFIITEGQTHEGAKPQQVVYLKDNTVFTTGFSKMSERQYGLWNDNNLTEALTIEEVDQSNGVQFIHYDPDCNLIYLCGKGDSTIRYFEVTDESPYVHYINMYQSSDPQRGIGWMPKRGMNVNHNEVARCYKLHTKGLCEVIPFTVPRKSELFQDDLYPDTIGDTPALTAEQWLNGENAQPILMSMKDGFVGKAKATRTKFVSKPKMTTSTTGDARSKSEPPTKAVDSKNDGLSNEVTILKREVESLRALCKSLGDRVNQLESLVASNGSTLSTATADDIEA